MAKGFWGHLRYASREKYQTRTVRVGIDTHCNGIRSQGGVSAIVEVYHPDKGGTSKQFQQLVAAWECVEKAYAAEQLPVKPSPKASHGSNGYIIDIHLEKSFVILDNPPVVIFDMIPKTIHICGRLISLMGERIRSRDSLGLPIRKLIISNIYVWMRCRRRIKGSALPSKSASSAARRSSL